MRDVAKCLPEYYSQLSNLCETLSSDYNIFLSIYENDSKDNTVDILRQLDFSFVDRVEIQTKTLNTKHYRSDAIEDRVKNLASARMECINVSNKELINKADNLLWIEADIAYNPSDVIKLLDWNRNMPFYDIVSMISVKTRTNMCRDIWATRKTINENPYGNVYPNWKLTPYEKYSSTFNGICLYKTEPIKNGASFHWYSEELGHFDCDTAVICEQFRKMGHGNIYIDHRLRNIHCKDHDMIKGKQQLNKI